jgi:short-subunit dehydrogenase
MIMPKPIEEQVFVITGASSGIGLLAATEAARRGARVVMAARNVHDLACAAEDICARGGNAVAVPADVTSLAQVENLAEVAVNHFGCIDTWVNCAGVTAYAFFKEQALVDFRQVLEVNFMGQVTSAKVALPYLEETDGALICIGSLLSDRGVPLQTAYCAAKHALKGWLDGLRVELKKDGSKVRVTLIKPASMDTPLFRKAKTQVEVEPAPIPPVLEPEKVVEAILHAAVSNQRDVYVGRAGRLLSLAGWFSPRLVDQQQLRHGFSAQTTGEPKGSDEPSNLFEPVAYDGGEHGGYRQEAWNERGSAAGWWISAAVAGMAAAGLAGFAGWKRLRTARPTPPEMEEEEPRRNPAPEFFELEVPVDSCRPAGEGGTDPGEATSTFRP